MELHTLRTLAWRCGFQKFDSKKCGECHICEIVCFLRHTGTCNPYQSRVRIVNKADRLPKLYSV